VRFPPDSYSSEAPLTTLLLTHPASLGHDMGPAHPERPDRIRAIERGLADERFHLLVRDRAPAATRAALLRVHPESYIGELESAAPSEGIAQIDADTAMGPGTLEAAFHAAGGACRAVDEVMSGGIDNCFVATRPPGHHAERATAMGFCFFNNAAIAARHAQAVYSAERVTIVDFDVHHGNGTQDIFWSDRSVLYCSTHQRPLYPGTGGVNETGEYGTIVNAPLGAGEGGVAFRAAFREKILPRVDAFAPDLVIVSAGFDAHRSDPLANLQLAEEDFAWVTLELMAIAERRAGGRLVSILEGGYHLDALARSAAAHVAALMGMA
jgi:acetoin utilization deacetylase AcuC-like enzyme